MFSNVKLRTIRNYLYASMPKGTDDALFLKQILPDSYDGNLCRDQGAAFFDGSLQGKGALSVQARKGLMRGNKKPGAEKRMESVKFAKDLRDKLAYNKTIIYLDADRGEETTIQNMVKKIWQLTQQSGEPIDNNHPLFQNVVPKALDENNKEADSIYKPVRVAIDTLLVQGSEVCVVYAVFLLIVTAILQYFMPEVSALYSFETISKVCTATAEIPIAEADGRNHVPFMDAGYMNEYHVYFYRDGYLTSSLGTSRNPSPDSDLWTGRLKMEIIDEKPVATMHVKSTIEAPLSGERDIVRDFHGTPMISSKDKMVYIGMTDQSQNFAFLTFAYTKFNNAEMYFRSGLLVSNAPETQYPVAQKIVITSRELSSKEIPYAKGLLKTNGKQLLITEAQYQAFQKQFADYSWMTEFKNSYGKMFDAHKITVYRFSEEELRGCSTSELDYQDRLRVLLALQSMESPIDINLHKFVESIPPSRTHTIMK